jgi:hypothetical protein
VEDGFAPSSIRLVIEMNQQIDATEEERFDDRSIYCRMLGHELTFRYCRSTADGAFCPRIFDCWYQRLDVFGYVSSFFSEEEIRGIINPGAPKMQTLVNLIKRAEGKE